MKKIIELMIIVAMLSLAGCGGSSSGDSGGGINVADSITVEVKELPSSPSTDPDYNTLEDVSMFSYMVPDGAFIIPESDAGYAKKTPTGISARVNHALSENLVTERQLEFDDFKDDGKTNGYYLSSLESTRTFDNTSLDGVTVSGTVTMVDTIYVGGKKLGLSYAEFGGWISSTNIQGKGSYLGLQLPINTSIQKMEGMWLGDASAEKGFDTTVGQAKTFRGNTIAVAYENNTNTLASKNAVISGSATMTVNPADLAASSLALDFADFYTLTLNNLEIQAGGSIAAGALSSVSARAKATNRTGIALGNALNINALDGQFYGSAAPSEAVGAFKIGDTTDLGVERGISGAFGVK